MTDKKDSLAPIPSDRVTSRVDPGLIRMLVDIKEGIDKAREEGNARGFLVEESIRNLQEDLGQANQRLDDLENYMKKDEKSDKMFKYEFRQLKSQVVNMQKELDDLRKSDHELQAVDAEIKKVQSDHSLEREAEMAAIIIHNKKLEKSILHMQIEVKKDPWVLGPALLLILVVFGFIWFGKISWEIGVGFIMAGGLMPAVLGKKKKKEEGLPKLNQKDDE